MRHREDDLSHMRHCQRPSVGRCKSRERSCRAQQAAGYLAQALWAGASSPGAASSGLQGSNPWASGWWSPGWWAYLRPAPQPDLLQR